MTSNTSNTDATNDTNKTNETVLYAVQIAHVTFSIANECLPVEWSDTAVWTNFKVYSETKKDGKHLIEEASNQEEAERILKESIEKLEERLERKRKGSPTAQQLMFLFSNEIPIPLTLTWGEASDIIDERMKQIVTEREAKKQAKALELRQKALDDRKALDLCQPGRKVLHAKFGEGTISGTEQAQFYSRRVKGSRIIYVEVQFQNDRKIIEITDLTPTNQE